MVILTVSKIQYSYSDTHAITLTFPALVVSLTSFVVQIFRTAGGCGEYSSPTL